LPLSRCTSLRSLKVHLITLGRATTGNFCVLATCLTHGFHLHKILLLRIVPYSNKLTSTRARNNAVLFREGRIHISNISVHHQAEMVRQAELAAVKELLPLSNQMRLSPDLLPVEDPILPYPRPIILRVFIEPVLPATPREPIVSRLTYM
jgi:hypothetical protein